MGTCPRIRRPPAAARPHRALTRLSRRRPPVSLRTRCSSARRQMTMTTRCDGSGINNRFLSSDIQLCPPPIEAAKLGIRCSVPDIMLAFDRAPTRWHVLSDMLTPTVAPRPPDRRVPQRSAARPSPFPFLPSTSDHPLLSAWSGELFVLHNTRFCQRPITSGACGVMAMAS